MRVEDRRSPRTTGRDTGHEERGWMEISRTARRNAAWKLDNAARYILPYPKKLANYLGLRAALLAGKTDHRFYPVKLGLEASGCCNLRCPLCPRGAMKTRTEGNMSWDGYTSLIDRLSPYLFQVRLHGLGEPMLNPRLPEMIRYAHERGVYTNFHTNGHFLTVRTIPGLLESGLDEINVAMDGMSQDTYGKYRVGGRFERVRDGITLLCEERRKAGNRRPRINLQFIVMAHNEHEIPALRLFASAAGVDRLYLKSVNITTGSEAGKEGYLPSDPAYRRTNPGDGELAPSAKLPTCSRVFMETVVNWDGSVGTCTGDHPGNGRIRGNLFTDGIEKILFGEECAKGRAKGFRKEYDECRYCVDSKSPV